MISNSAELRFDKIEVPARGAMQWWKEGNERGDNLGKNLNDDKHHGKLKKGEKGRHGQGQGLTAEPTGNPAHLSRTEVTVLQSNTRQQLARIGDAAPERLRKAPRKRQPRLSVIGTASVRVGISPCAGQNCSIKGFPLDFSP